MQTKRFIVVLGIGLGLTALLPNRGSCQIEPLDIQVNNSIVFLGNTFAERMHQFGYFEAFLHSRFPHHRLRVRNMGWAADEVDKMIRPSGFPKLLGELEGHKTDLIFLCFGMNESFGGPARVDHYQHELGNFVKELKGQKFNGQTAPRIVLVSPIAHEDLDDVLPDGTQHNRNLRLYSEAMAQVGAQHVVRYVDLFSPTSKWMGDHADKKLTFNGIHLTEFGDWIIRQMMGRDLGLIDEIASPEGSANPMAENFRRLVYEKTTSITHGGICLTATTFTVGVTTHRAPRTSCQNESYSSS